MALIPLRLPRELESLTKAPIENISAGPIDGDLLNWRATIHGPMHTPYEGGIFPLLINFPQNYPFCPPNVVFTIPIYHPNIHPITGEIGLDIFKSNWNAAYTIEKVLLGICSLLSDPNPDDPIHVDSAELYKSDRAEYERIAQEWTLEHANK